MDVSENVLNKQGNNVAELRAIYR